jgi:hypothetical protein
MTGDEFQQAWKGVLTRLPAAAPLPPKIADFLVDPGLPTWVTLGSDDVPMELRFSPLEAGLVALPLQLVQHADALAPFADLLVFGEAHFEGGADQLWCLHSPSGVVESFDIELEEPLALVNQSVSHLAASLLAFRRWAEGGSRNFDQLRSALEAADDRTWGVNIWTGFADALEQLDAGIVFTTA